MPQATQTRRITISVDTQGSAELKAIAAQLGDLNKTTQGLGEGFAFLTQGALAFIGGLSIRELASFSDQMQNLQNRLIGVTGSQEQANALMSQLAQVARDTNGSLSGTVEVYGRVALALKAANISSQTTIEFTQALTNTFRLSGHSADEAAAAVTSLAYGFQKGELTGRELRTVLRENSVLAGLLKQQFGSGLTSAANDGFISTAQVMKIVLDHMGDINARAAQLNATVGQSLTKGMDAFKLKIFEVNQSLGFSGGFGAVIDSTIKHMGGLLTVLTIMAVTTIPFLITKITQLAIAFAAMNPIVAIIEGITAGLIALEISVFGNSTDIGGLIEQMKEGFQELKAIADEAIGRLYDFLALIGKFAPSGSAASNAAAGYKAMADASRQAAADARLHARAMGIEYEANKALAALQQQQAEDAARRAADLANVGAKIRPEETRQKLLAELNREYRQGQIDISDYNKKLQEVDIKTANIEFRDGKYDLEKWNEAHDAKKIFDFNQELRKGVITFQQYDDAIRNIQLGKLNRELESGKISLEQYNLQLAAVTNQFSTNGAFRTGLQEYVSAIGTTTSQVAGLIKNTFAGLETQLFNFVKTGKFNFEQFTQSVLDDLLKIIIRMEIVAPIARGILGLASSPNSITTTSPGSDYGSAGGGGSFDTTAAHGQIFDRGLVKFAAGGVVSSPTVFGFGGGQKGLMGEAGPEAIIPLSRGGDGNLGVKASVTPVTINIINQSGNEVQQSESTGPNGDKQIEIIITSKVREGFSKGSYDKILKGAFGLSRKGT